MKKSFSTKEPVRIRTKKLANGNLSLYLDIYADGKRQYEFLKLYLIPEHGPTDHWQNEETLKLARIIKARKVLELQSSAHGFRICRQTSLTLADYARTLADQSVERHGTKTTLRALVHHLNRYSPGGIPLHKVDMAYVVGFLAYLKEARQQHSKQEKPLHENTRCHYFKLLSLTLRRAVAEGLLADNPVERIDREIRPKRRHSERVYLTMDELTRLARTPLHNELLRKAFLFSCFCGLRHCDIVALTWNNLCPDGEDGVSLRLVQQKTHEALCLPLSGEALKQLPHRGLAKGGEKVFAGLISLGRSNELLPRWAAAAGIDKHITFHTARHTHATMLLTLGADLYTVSKLLGHNNIRTTQVYARVVDECKKKAVRLIPELT